MEAPTARRPDRRGRPRCIGADYGRGVAPETCRSEGIVNLRENPPFLRRKRSALERRINNLETAIKHSEGAQTVSLTVPLREAKKELEEAESQINEALDKAHKESVQ